MGNSDSQRRARSRERGNYGGIHNAPRQRSRSPQRSHSADGRFATAISYQEPNPGLRRDREFEVLNATYLICHDLQNILDRALPSMFQAHFVILHYYPDERLRRMYNDKEILLKYIGVLESLTSRIDSHSLETLDRLRNNQTLRSMIYREWYKLSRTLQAAREGSYLFCDDTSQRFGVCEVAPNYDGLCEIRNRPARETTLRFPVYGLIKALDFLSDVFFYTKLPLELAVDKVKAVLNRLLIEVHTKRMRLDAEIDFETNAGMRPPDVEIEMEQPSRPNRGILRDPNIPRDAESRGVQFTRSARRSSVPQRFRNLRYSVFGGNEYPTHNPRGIPPPRNFAEPLTNMIPHRGTVLRTSPGSPPRRQRYRRRDGIFRSLRDGIFRSNESNSSGIISNTITTTDNLQKRKRLLREYTSEISGIQRHRF